MKYLIVSAVCLLISWPCFSDGGYDQNAGGYDPSIAQRREAEEKAAHDSLLKAQQATARKAEQKRRAEKDKAEAESIADAKKKLKENAPDFLKSLSNVEMCALYGSAIRNESRELNPLDFDGSFQFVLNEAARRKLTVNSDLAKNPKLKIGMSVCDLFTAYGWPEKNNRTVSASGVSIQHIYNSQRIKAYVYTDNGVVKSWQD